MKVKKILISIMITISLVGCSSANKLEDIIKKDKIELRDYERQNNHQTGIKFKKIQFTKSNTLKVGDVEYNIILAEDIQGGILPIANIKNNDKNLMYDIENNIILNRNDKQYYIKITPNKYKVINKYTTIRSSKILSKQEMIFPNTLSIDDAKEIYKILQNVKNLDSKYEYENKTMKTNPKISIKYFKTNRK